LKTYVEHYVAIHN